jgi:hypothetical protein
MSLTKLFPAIKMLPRADKLRLMQFLVIDLAMKKACPCSQQMPSMHLWTPLHAFKPGL